LIIEVVLFDVMALSLEWKANDRDLMCKRIMHVNAFICWDYSQLFVMLNEHLWELFGMVN